MRVRLLAKLGCGARESGHLRAARRFFERGATRGDGVCCISLAHIYDVGLGTRVDKKRAMHWYKLAWRSRDRAAAGNIAILYRESGNHRLAFIWFEQAAKAGDGDALVELAKCFLGGIGIRRDKSAAIRHVRAAIAHTPYEGTFGITPFGWEEAESMLHDLSPESTSGEDSAS